MNVSFCETPTGVVGSLTSWLMGSENGSRRSFSGAVGISSIKLQSRGRDATNPGARAARQAVWATGPSLARAALYGGGAPDPTSDAITNRHRARVAPRRRICVHRARFIDAARRSGVGAQSYDHVAGDRGSMVDCSVPVIAKGFATHNGPRPTL